LFDRTTPRVEAAASSGGEQLDGFLDRRIGSLFGGLERAVEAFGEGTGTGDNLAALYCEAG